MRQAVTEEEAQIHSQSAVYEPDNLLDRLSRPETLQVHYDHLFRREKEIVDRRLGLLSGTVLSVGAGWHPGRHLFPAPSFRLTAVDADPARVAGLRASRSADSAFVGIAGELSLKRSFDVVLYRLVLHHIAYQGPLAPCFTEASRLLRPGGALLAIEPGLFHPVGLGLQLANRVGLARAMHGTPDDIPLSPRELIRQSRHAGLDPELHALTYTWRRIPAAAQRSLQVFDSIGSRPRTAPFGHTILLIARKPSSRGRQPDIA